VKYERGAVSTNIKETGPGLYRCWLLGCIRIDRAREERRSEAIMGDCDASVLIRSLVLALVEIIKFRIPSHLDVTTETSA
jgi:hypothetical protein